MRVVLNEERLLAVVPGLLEEEIGRRGGIENGLAVNLGGGDVVGKLFVNEAVDGMAPALISWWSKLAATVALT